MIKDYKSLQAAVAQDRQYKHDAIGDKYYLCTARHDKSADRFAMACRETVLIRLTVACVEKRGQSDNRVQQIPEAAAEAL